MSHEPLPRGWVLASLGDLISEIVGGGTPSKSNPSYFDGNIPFMTVKDLKGRFPASTQDYITSTAVKESSTRIVPADSLVIATRMALGRIARPTFETAINQDLKALFLASGINKTFFEHWWRSEAKKIESLGTGTTVKGIRIEDIKALELPLPPLAEQRRIADKLDALLSRVEAARERLERVPKLLKQFRQAVLNAAVSGELTREWRGGGDAEWDTTSIGQLAEDIRYGTAKKCDYDVTGSPVLRIPNVGSGRIDISDLKYSHFDPAEREKLALRAGDILLIRSNGSADLVGKPCIVTGEHEGFLFAGYLIRIRLKKLIDPTFAWYRLSAPDIRTGIEARARSSAGVHNINAEEIRQISFAIPSLREQAEIVRRVEALFAFADRLEARYEAALASFDRLTPALLAKAFRGELVPQDPNDEPASVLLERIRAERAAAGAGKAQRGRKAGGSARQAKAAGEQPAKRRGRPPKASAEPQPDGIAQASSYEDAVRLLQEKRREREAEAALGD